MPFTSDTTCWFAEEILPHATLPKAYLRDTFPSVRDTENVVQESYLRVWRAKVAGSVESAGGHLFCANRQLAIIFLLKRSRSPVTPLEPIRVFASRDVPEDTPCPFEPTDAIGNSCGSARLSTRCRSASAKSKSSASPRLCHTDKSPGS